jgi:uncharacterized membrane protein YagU involved in acid resistance
MQQKISRAITAGIIGTLAMTIIGYLAPLMRMPKMNPPETLARMMSMSIVLGWITHFMIGIIFGFSYVYLISGWLSKINSHVLKGVVFGIILFVFAQIAMKILNTMMGGMASADNTLLMTMGSLIGHLVYGLAVALVAKETPRPVSI